MISAVGASSSAGLAGEPDQRAPDGTDSPWPSTDCSPRPDLTPTAAPGSITVFAPTNAPRPTVIGATITRPSSTHHGRIETPYPIEASAPISIRLGRLMVLVAIVVRRPTRAPSSRRYVAISGEPLRTDSGPIANNRFTAHSRT